MKKLSILLCMMLGTTVLLAQSVTQESDWWVQVKLTSGSRVEGAVLADRFVERALQSRIYEKVQDENFRNLPGTGIRVYYVKDNPGFVFIPYVQVERVIILRRMSTGEKEEIVERIRHTRLVQAQEVSESEQIKEQERLKKAGVGLTVDEEKVRTEEDKKKQQAIANMQVPREAVLQRMAPGSRMLLTTYPPGDTWSDDEYKKLNAQYLRAINSVHYKTVNGKKIAVRDGAGKAGGLTNLERGFRDNYQNWKSAIAEFNRQEKVLKEEMYKKAEAESEAKAKEEKTALKDELVEEIPLELLVDTPGKTAPKTEKKPKTGAMTSGEIQKSIDTLLFSKSTQEKLQAIYSLEECGAKAKNALIPLSNMVLDDKNPAVQKAAIHALGEIQEPYETSIPPLMQILELSGDVTLRREAASAMLRLGDMGPVHQYQKKYDSVLLALSSEDDNLVKYRIIRLTESIGESLLLNLLPKAKEEEKQVILDDLFQYIDAVKVHVNSADPAIQIATCSALLSMVQDKEKLNTPWLYQPLLDGLVNPDVAIGKLAAQALKRLDSPDTHEKIKAAMANDEVDNQVKEILQEIVGGSVMLNTVDKPKTVTTAPGKPQDTETRPNTNFWDED